MRPWLFSSIAVLFLACTAPSAPQAPRQAAVTPAPPRPAEGAEAHLWTDGLPAIHLAVDTKSYAEWNASAAINDFAGQRELIAARRAFPVTAGTRLLVLENTLATTRVRVLEGPQSGRTGWTEAEWVR